MEGAKATAPLQAKRTAAAARVEKAQAEAQQLGGEVAALEGQGKADRGKAEALGRMIAEVCFYWGGKGCLDGWLDVWMYVPGLVSGLLPLLLLLRTRRDPTMTHQRNAAGEALGGVCGAACAGGGAGQEGEPPQHLRAGGRQGPDHG